jgi:hypothetical protein
MTAAIWMLYDIAEAADALNVPFSWLQDKVTARQVPNTRLGKHLRFTEGHLAQIVAEGYRPAREERVGRRKAA